jgi:hypothetical protein
MIRYTHIEDGVVRTALKSKDELAVLVPLMTPFVLRDRNINLKTVA